MPVYDARLRRAGEADGPGYPDLSVYARPGSVPFPPGHHCGVYDAAGGRLGPLLWCDTETGEAEVYVRDPAGTWQTNPDHTVRTAVGFHPAPLRLLPAPGG
jgi:hypothetical protein